LTVFNFLSVNFGRNCFIKSTPDVRPVGPEQPALRGGSRASRHATGLPVEPLPDVRAIETCRRRQLRRDPALLVRLGDRSAHDRLPGIDFMNLHFGRKLFRTNFILKFWTNLHPKTTDIDLSDYCGQQPWI
jgi:hypothetical protein